RRRCRCAAPALHDRRAGQHRGLVAAAGAARCQAGRAAARPGAARPRRRAALHRTHSGQGRAPADADGIGRRGRDPGRRRCRHRRAVPRRRDARMRAGARLAWALAWLVVLLGLGAWLSQSLTVSGDLRRFLPDARTAEQRLLIEELGEGPGSRLLLVALSGAAPAELAAQSQAVHAALADDPRFVFVANGAEAGLDAIPERLRPYRYLLSPRLDDGRLDEAMLADALEARLQDLGSPAADLVEPLLPSDPTLETLALAEAWRPASAPQLLHGAWFDRAGAQALLLLETRAAGFDPDGQREAVAAIRAAFAAARGDSGATIEIIGPGAFADE